MRTLFSTDKALITFVKDCQLIHEQFMGAILTSKGNNITKHSSILLDSSSLYIKALQTIVDEYKYIADSLYESGGSKLRVMNAIVSTDEKGHTIFNLDISGKEIEMEFSVDGLIDNMLSQFNIRMDSRPNKLTDREG